MYTLNLAEVKLSPPITEEKKFENEDQYALQDEVIAYIQANYPNVYANEFTVKRHVEAAIRDEKGATFDERHDAEWAQKMKESKERAEQGQAVSDAIAAEFEPKLNEVHAWADSEMRKVVEEYSSKISDVSDEERKSLDEEQALKFDYIQLESQKRRDAINEEIEARIAEAKKDS